MSPTEIAKWIEEDFGSDGADRGTAICPRCGVDAVLPSAAPIALDHELLHEMRSFWLGH